MNNESTTKSIAEENTIQHKSFVLAVEGLNLSVQIQAKSKEYVLSKQLMRSITSVGAMVREAQQAESKADFIHKLSIALKEAKESEYWVELLIATKFLEKKNITNFESLLKDCINLLIAIIKSTKSGLKK